MLPGLATAAIANRHLVWNPPGIRLVRTYVLLGPRRLLAGRRRSL
jgi:hypothetical protein